MSGLTRERILDAATRLIAVSDSRGASLRAIARAAGVNSALIHYHFGGREALYDAVLLEALAPVQARRKRMIESIREQASPPPARSLARLFVVPLLADPGEDAELAKLRLRLMARAFQEDRGRVLDLTLKHWGDLMYGLGDLLGDALPHLSPETKHRRARLCVLAAIETLSGPEMEAARSDGPEAVEALTTELIAFLAGGLEAPSPD